mgnify:CR=1 FL=1
MFASNSNRVERLEKCKIAQKSAEKLNVIKVLQAYSNSLKIVDGRIEENAIDGYALIEVKTVKTKATVTTSLFKKEENEEAEKIAKKANIHYIANKCIKQEYQKLFQKMNPVFPVLKA